MTEQHSESDPVDELAEEFAERYRRGERPSVTDYTERFPHLAERIRELFPALVVLEELGSVAGAVSHETAAEKRRVPQQLGDFRILRHVGHGGMGMVYEAVQESLGRHVAIKILPAHALMNSTLLERFRREARAAARLHHTNIVPVFGVGEHHGIHYYAMQYIPGQGLDEVLHEVARLRRNATAPSSAAVDGDSQAPVSKLAHGLSGEMAGSRKAEQTGHVVSDISEAERCDLSSAPRSEAPTAEAGGAIVRALAAEKMKLVLAARSAGNLASLSTELQAHGAEAIAVRTDLREQQDLESLVRVAQREFGSIDVLVNNAAIVNLFPFHKLQAADIERVIHVNLTSAMILVRLVLPGMLERGRGHIVNISSIAAKGGAPCDEAYAASKAGLVGFTRSLRSEYRQSGVSASVICPGFVRGAGMSQEIMEKTGLARPRFIRGCSPESVARSVVRAIRRDVPEILLGRPPMKPLSVLLELSPRLGEWLVARLGLFSPLGHAAKANEDMGGSLTGIGERPDGDLAFAVSREPIQNGRLFNQADEGIGRG